MDCINFNAYGKINIGLDVIGKRPDGYHEVKMIMQTVPVYDELSFEKTNGPITLTVDNPSVPTDEKNLAYKAALLFKEKYQVKGGVKIDIKKHIPAAAGLAGGSADAAATLKAMTALYEIKASEKELDSLAVKIGADVPFCLRSGTYLSEGVGEILTKLDDFPACYVLLINPGIEVSTKWAYEALDEEIKSYQKEPSPVTKSCQKEPSPVTQEREIMSSKAKQDINENEEKAAPLHPNIDKIIEAIHEKDLKNIAANMGNILEIPVLKKYLEIKNIKEQLEKNGAIVALMSGSGSSVFGIFDSKGKIDTANKSIKGENYVRFSFEFR